jgi:hypothetical protein
MKCLTSIFSIKIWLGQPRRWLLAFFSRSYRWRPQLRSKRANFRFFNMWDLFWKSLFLSESFFSPKKLLLRRYLFFFWVVFRVGQHICIRILNKNIFFCLFCHDFIAMFILLKRGLNLWFKPRYFKIRQFLCFLKTWNVLRSWDVIKSS